MISTIPNPPPRSIPTNPDPPPRSITAQAKAAATAEATTITIAEPKTAAETKAVAEAAAKAKAVTKAAATAEAVAEVLEAHFRVSRVSTAHRAHFRVSGVSVAHCAHQRGSIKGGPHPEGDGVCLLSLSFAVLLLYSNLPLSQALYLITLSSPENQPCLPLLRSHPGD